jgi:hypothetical protein
MPRSRKHKLKINERINQKPEPEQTIEPGRVREVAGPGHDYSEVFAKTEYEKMMLKLARRQAREEEEEGIVPE